MPEDGLGRDVHEIAFDDLCAPRRFGVDKPQPGSPAPRGAEHPERYRPEPERLPTRVEIIIAETEGGETAVEDLPWYKQMDSYIGLSAEGNSTPDND